MLWILFKIRVLYMYVALQLPVCSKSLYLGKKVYPVNFFHPAHFQTMGHPALVFRPAHNEISDNVPPLVFVSSEYKEETAMRLL